MRSDATIALKMEKSWLGSPQKGLGALPYGLFRGRTSKTAPSTITAAPIKTWTMNPVPSVSSPAITTELVRITMIPVTIRASPATFLRATIRTPGGNRASNIKAFFSYLVLNIAEQASFPTMPDDLEVENGTEFLACKDSIAERQLAKSSGIAR